MEPSVFIIAVIVVGALLMISIIVSRFLTTVDAGTIRLVTKIGGTTSIYRGPGKAFEVPLITTGTTIPSKAINIDLDIADQTADVDASGMPKPIKVRVLASAIVSVGDSDEMIMTAANKFFSRPDGEQNAILSDLLTSTGRRAINLLNHDELFSARARTESGALLSPTAVEDDDRLAIIIKSACSRELQDLGLVFNSLNIKEVQSEVAEARRRQSAVEAKANADIVAADQDRRAKEAQLQAEQAVNDKQRDLEQRRAQNAATIAEAEATRQTALAKQREAELKATQIAQANADAARMRVQADADADRVRVQAEAAAEAEAVKIRALGAAQADAIRAVNSAIREGGDAYLALRQLEMLPQITPSIAQALAQAKLININSGTSAEGSGAAGSATDQISGVIQTLLATQLVNGQLRIDGSGNGNGNGSSAYGNGNGNGNGVPVPALTNGTPETGPGFDLGPTTPPAPRRK
jgi:flotillin